MFQTGFPVSAQDKQEKQKQKKKLSFREPEIEGPQKPKLFSTSRLSSRGYIATSRKSSSLEDLSLEDHALQIAQSVGQAFSVEPSSYLDTRLQNNWISPQSETDCSPSENESNQRICQLRNFHISAEDQNYLDAFSPPILDLTMKCPRFETADLKPHSTTSEDSYADGSHHQLQILRYQLNQQNQQTQAALHQIQLLKDQLQAESTTRCKAQMQNHQLMVQNKELLDHIERLFVQIDDLEKHIQTIENEMHGPKIPFVKDSKMTKYTAFQRRRLSCDQSPEKRTTEWRFSSAEKGSITPACTDQNKMPMTQMLPKSLMNRKGSVSLATKQFSNQMKGPDLNDKVLRIGDTSPPIQSGTLSPYGAGWKLKPLKTNSQPVIDKSVVAVRNQTNSLSLDVKSNPTNIANTRNTTVTNNSNSSMALCENRQISGKYTDSYRANSSSAHISNPLMIEDSSSSATSSTASKLPQYPQHRHWYKDELQTEDKKDVYQIGKDSFHNSFETSLHFSK